MRIAPAIVLSTLLFTPNFGTDWVIDGQTETKTLNGQTIKSVQLQGNGNLTVNSTGASTIDNMQMYWLEEGASTTFNINSGTLNLNLGIANIGMIQNSVNFNVLQGATLILTNGKDSEKFGNFRGLNTKLEVNLLGTLQGNLSNDGTSAITVHKNANLQGNIVQDAGSLMTRIEGKLEGSIISTRDTQKMALWANDATNIENRTTATITGNIIQGGGSLEGIMKNLELQGSFTQTGGTSDIAFWHSEFKSDTTLSDAFTTIHFYGTNLQSVNANNGKATINLKKSSKMTNYHGINAISYLNLEGASTVQNVSQTGGDLDFRAIENSKIQGSITGSNDAKMFIAVIQSTVTGSVTNTNGRTNMSILEGSTIQGNITHTHTRVGNVNIADSTVKGNYTQIGGTLTQLILLNSTIDQGISLTEVGTLAGRLNLNFANTKINQGIHINKNTDALVGSISDHSKVTGGYEQVGGERMQITFKNSILEGGIQVRDSGPITNGNTQDPQSYMTALLFTEGSIFNDGIKSNNHSTWIGISGGSKGDGNIEVTRGNFSLNLEDNATHTGSFTAQDAQETFISLNNKSKLTGHVIQTNGKQNIALKQFSILEGNIQSTNTDTALTLRFNSELQGFYKQDGGLLDFTIGGASIIAGDVTLNEVQTTIGNGNATDRFETIKGNFTQNGGSLTGKLDGLTLNGKFTQTGGTSDVLFGKADFQQPSIIKNAQSSNITFDAESKLRDYTIIDSGKDNSLILDNRTVLTGNFKLENSSSILKILNGSRITGNIISENEGNNLDMTITGGSSVGGDVIISNGKADGDFNGATIDGSLKLTDANSHFHFKNSQIGEDIDILRGTTIITLDNTSVDGFFRMREEGPNIPTLKLKISNGSTIGENLIFKNTQAFIGGEGLGNVIEGNLISDDSTLTNGGAKYGGTGNPFPISGLTIKGTLQQNNGTLDLNFSNNSDIQGKTILSKGNFSHLTISQNSKLGVLEVIEGQDNLITLKGASSQEGGITLNNTTTKIQAFDRSSITGDITAIAEAPTVSNTHLVLKRSSFDGNFRQSNGKATFDFTNDSRMNGNVMISNLEFKANLDDSLYMGTLTATNTQTEINLSNNSLFDSQIQSTNSAPFSVNANNGSTLKGQITHSGANGNNLNLSLRFTNNSTLENTSMSIIGNAKIDASNSTINSTEGIDLDLGKLDISLNNSRGTIQNLKTAGNNTINIVTTNSSDSTITELLMQNTSTLTLLADNRAVIRGHLTLKHISNATITSRNNAQVRFDINPDPDANLEIGLNGGMLIGEIFQNAPSAGTMTLGQAGDFGGRWVMTKDSTLKSLNITNSSSSINNEEVMKADTFISHLSIVDLSRDAQGNQTRIGLELTQAEENVELLPTQTRAKTLKLGSLGGLNGVFRVYADLGTGLSDKVITNKAQGTHVVQVYYNPRTFTQNIQDKYIPVIQVKDNQTSANFLGGTTHIGIQSYETELIKVAAQDGNGFDWIIGSTQNLGPSYGTKVISSIMQSQYRTIFALNQSLNERLGDIRGATRASGLWARYSMGQTSSKESESTIDTKDNFYSVWAGYDHNVLDLRGSNFAGFAVSYTEFSPDNKDYTGKLQTIGFNLYDTFWAKNDFYFDLVFQYAFTLSDYNITYISLSKNTPKYTNHKILASAEIGKNFKLQNKPSNYFFIQPEAQVTSGYVLGNDVSFIDSSSTKIDAHLSSFTPVILRGGIFVGRDLDYFIRGDVRLGASILYELNTGGNVTLDDGMEQMTYKHGSDLKAILEIGTNLILNDSARLHFEALTSFFGNSNINYAINAGVRFSFGYKNTRKLIVPPFRPQTPPPPPPYDPRNLSTIQDNTRTDIQNNLNTRPRTPYNSDYFINTRKAFRDQVSF